MSEPAVVNIAASLAEMARSRPHALAAACPDGRSRDGRTRYVLLTFRQLDRESDAMVRVLRDHGVARGTRTVLMVKPSLDFFVLTFALFKAGAVPVLVDPGMGRTHLGRCLAEAAPEVFVGIPLAQTARRLFGWGKETIRQTLTVGPGMPRGDLDGPPELCPTSADEMAAILYTSGSTGPPKGAIYTHGIFATQVRLLRELYGIEPGEVDLCTFPLFALFAPALGMTAIVPDMDATRPGWVDPRNILEPIEKFGVTNMFGSPALIRRVGAYGERHGLKLPTLRRVISAGAPVPAPVLERFAALLGPETQIFTPYGATESLPVASMGSREILAETRHATDRGEGVCVGRPVGPLRLEVIRITDEPIPTWSDDLRVPAGEVGELAVQGPVVTRGYFRRPAADALAKIDDPGTGGFFHRMGDLGRVDDQGRVWYYGRKSHRVQTAEGPLFTEACEAVFNTHPDVERTALVGLGPAGSARPVLCVEPARRLGPRGRKRVRAELTAIAARFPHTRSIETFLFHPAFPVDIRHNAKIFREKLAVWAGRKLR